MNHEILNNHNLDPLQTIFVTFMVLSLLLTCEKGDYYAINYIDLALAKRKYSFSIYLIDI